MCHRGNVRSDTVRQVKSRRLQIQDYRAGKALGPVASCVGNADDASGLVNVVGSGGEVNRCLLGERLAEALPSIDLAHGDLP